MSGGVVVWLTGLPSSGKTTLALRLRAALAVRGRCAVLLDGDEVRGALVPTLGHTPPERDAYYQTLARLAATLARQDLVIIVAATAHRRAHRERARELAPRMLEVYLRAPLEECEARDAKGLYALARRGEAPHLPGIGERYQPSDAPEVIARGGHDDAALAEILRQLDAGTA